MRKEEREFIGLMRWRPASHSEARIFPSEQVGGGVISSPSCVSWRFHLGWTTPPRVSCWSPSGAQSVATAMEGFLGILVILHKMRGERRFRSDFLEGVFQQRSEDLSSGTSLIFAKKTPRASSGVPGQWREQ